MKDIKVVRMIFPNDPTLNLDVHQMFVSIYDAFAIEFYSVSSVFGKESRVYGEDKDCYFPIVNNDQIDNAFKSPSFIDCAKSYVVLNPREDYTRLSGRSIDVALRDRILIRIEDCKKRGIHITHYMEEADLKAWNRKL